MRKEGYRDSTIRGTVNTLKAVGKRTDLLNPESVKAWLTSSPVSINRKEKICQDLARFYKWKGTPFNMPRYQRIIKIPFIPLEAEVDQLISGCGKFTATFLQLAKETGCTSGELWDLKWTDIDFQRLGWNRGELRLRRR
jgi:integrase